MTYLTKPIVTLLIFGVCFTSWCQNMTWEMEGRYAKVDSLIDAIDFNTFNELNQLGFSTRYYKPYVKSAKEHVLQKLYGGHYIRKDTLERKLSAVFKRLCQANGFDFTPVILIEDNPTLNAGVNVIGVFQFTLGLMTLVQNDDELAMVVAHELAHHMSFHVADAIYDFHHLDIEAIHYNEFKKIVNGRGTMKGLKSMQSVSYELQKNRRNRELEADSLGMIYMEAAGYSSMRGVAVLPRLGYHYLDEESSGRSVLQALFSAKYPPRDYWFKERMPTFKKKPIGLYDQDSISSHPDMEVRLKRTQDLIVRLDSLPGPALSELSQANCLELVKGAYTSREYEACLYLALKAHLKYPDNPFYTTVIGRVFLDLNKSLNNNNLESNIHMFVDYYTLNLSENLKEVNAFIYNLTGEELLEIGYHFINNSAIFNPACQEHYLLLLRYAQLTHRETIASKVKTMYESQFAETLYYKL